MTMKKPKSKKKYRTRIPSEASLKRERQMLRRGYMSPGAASLWASVPQQTIYTWIRKGKLNPQRVGPDGPKRRIYVSAKELRALVGPSGP